MKTTFDLGPMNQRVAVAYSIHLVHFFCCKPYGFGLAALGGEETP